MFEKLFECVDKRARMDEDILKKSLGEPLEEQAVQKRLKKLAKENNTDYACFLGGGSYKRFIPSAIAAVASRFEFLSAYTPYQAEMSQGTLQAMYEFQSLICDLTNQDASNASVYDGASACAEGLLMACRISKRKKVWISENINPNYKKVIHTYLWAGEIELTQDENDPELAARLYQFPNYFGEVEHIPSKRGKELVVVALDLVAAAVLEPPQADITVGDFQSFGLPVNFGGPYGGFVACKDAHKRSLAGRIAGKTLDKEGKEAYTLTMQAREQHIKREKATSNICSNQAHCALVATVYLLLTGKKGLEKIAKTSYENAHNLANGLKANGHKVLSKDFFSEFVLEVDDSDEFLGKMKAKNILAGIKIDKNKVLVATTELNDSKDLESYITASLF